MKIGDILLCKDGAGIGKVAIINHLPDKATVNSSLLVMRAMDVFIPDFLYYLLKGPTMQRLVNEKIYGSAIPHLFQKDIKKFQLKVPPIEEQKQIVQEIEYRFTIIENLELAIKRGIDKAEVLRQSILKSAFSGKLISQNKMDEHADILIKKIYSFKKQYEVVSKEAKRSKPKKIKMKENNKTALEILSKLDDPISARDLWQESVHKDDIEAFYNELKSIYSQIKESILDSESYISLKK